MRFSIITPTLQRESLLKCCASVDEQTFSDWQHIVIDDSPEDQGVLTRISADQRVFGMSGESRRNHGNNCRRAGWEIAAGDWVYYLDDDNYLAHPDALADAAAVLDSIEEKWALFPIFRHGNRFFFDPPQPCYFDTGNAMVRKEIAQWPNVDDYASDAIWLTATLLKHPYRAFPNAKPLMVMPTTNFCK
jgi:glycosyltransferase involved in cell wall biosynthesis